MNASPEAKAAAIEELEDWKKSAEKVFADLNLQEIGKELDLTDRARRIRHPRRKQ